MQGALAGLKVLDLSRYIAGPFCGMLLGDMGADVIKIETPEKGENTRAFHPRVAGSSLYTMVFNRNKRSMTLNFRHPEAQAVLRDLMQQADVVIENFLPGTLEKMGCGWDVVSKLNPRLIMTRISGFGASGPYSNEPCFDMIAQAMSGIMDLTGQPDGPPTMAGTFVADYSTALYAAIGTMGALQSRERTGAGQIVETTLLSSSLSLLVTAIPKFMLFGQGTTRNGNRDRFVAPSNTFPTADGDWVILQAPEDKFKFLAAGMGRNDLAIDPRFATNAARLENVEALEQEIAAWTSTQSTDAVLAMLKEGRIPSAKVATIADVVNNPQVQHNGNIIWTKHGEHDVPMQGFTVNFSETPMALQRSCPGIGEHTEEILSEWLNLSSSDAQRLRVAKAI